MGKKKGKGKKKEQQVSNGTNATASEEAKKLEGDNADLKSPASKKSKVVVSKDEASTKTTTTSGDNDNKSTAAPLTSSPATKKKNVENHLKDRPTLSSVPDKIVNPAGATKHLANNLAGTARKLSRNLIAGKIDRHLVTRPEKIQNAGVISDVAPGIASKKKKLERNMTADKISQALDSRPTISDLKDQGKVPTMMDSNLAPKLSAVAKTLERKIVTNIVSDLIKTRPSPRDVENIVDTDIAPKIARAKFDLDRNRTSDQLSRLLRRRPSKEDLLDDGVLRDEESSMEQYGMASSPNEEHVSRRGRYALALKACVKLLRDNLIDSDEKGRLKDLILRDDDRVLAAIECFELDQEAGELLDTLYRIAKLTV